MPYYQETIKISAPAEQVFAFVDDHRNFTSHMNKSSWVMGGGRMETTVDIDGGQKIGSHIRMTGKVFGISLELDEIITKREPPRLKAWETVGNPKLVVIGNYAMRAEIVPNEQGCMLTISIDYELTPAWKWFGKIAGPLYAKWCVRQMAKAVKAKYP